MNDRRIVGVIPARYQSSRFPGKPLADLEGWPVLRHVYERARRVAGVDRVIVATDDARIRDAAEAFSAEVVMTSARHATGTDRVAEAARALDADIIVNLQGDEPLLEPAMVEQVIAPLLRDEAIRVTTMITPVTAIAEALDLNVVKVVTDLAGDVLCYSRSPVPYPKDRSVYGMRKQIGLYAFRRGALEAFAGWEPSPLEVTEGVELFRFLEHGWSVRAVETAHGTVAVDTPADLERVRRLLRRRTKAVSHA